MSPRLIGDPSATLCNRIFQITTKFVDKVARLSQQVAEIVVLSISCLKKKFCLILERHWRVSHVISVWATKQFGYAAVARVAGRVLTRPSWFFAAKGGHIGRPQDICQ